MGNDTVLHITIGVVAMATTAVFTAGGFYIYVQLTLKHLQEQVQQSYNLLKEDAEEVHKRLDQKIDKNYETLEGIIDDNQEDFRGDLAGIGTKVSKNERDAARRYHNISVALMLAVDPKQEKLVSKLMKEEAV